MPTVGRGAPHRRSGGAESEERVLLALVRLAMDASVRAAADVGGVSPVQLRALTALRELGQANLAQLAEEIGVTVSTASRLVDRLVGADWVDRAAAERDRREIRVSLTGSGERLLRRYDERRVDQLTECLHRIPAERRESVVRALAELTQVARA